MEHQNCGLSTSEHRLASVFGLALARYIENQSGPNTSLERVSYLPESVLIKFKNPEVEITTYRCEEEWVTSIRGERHMAIATDNEPLQSAQSAFGAYREFEGT